MCQVGLKSFEDIGRHMVKKCGRLPLAISVVGGILRKKETVAEWEKVSGNIDSYLNRGEGSEINKRVKHVLDLSYDVLPYYLKACFLYLACFPEDKEIETKELYFLWIAEGLISYQDKGSNETLRDVAERYLSELAFRSMVQVQKDEEEAGHDKFTSCRLHDLMCDLSLSKAKEINFLKRFEQLHSESPSSVVTSSSKLVVYFEHGDPTTLSIDEINKINNLRSLLILPKNKYGSPICFQDIKIDFSKSKGLRVLRLSGCLFAGKTLPRKVDKLVHLRYLSLYGSELEELPRSICDLPYLHTLDLRVNGSIKLPNIIYKMKKLRHLFLESFSVIGGDKLILDGLKELETLDAFSSDSVCIADIPKLTNLRKLGVKVDDMDSAARLAHYMCKNESQLSEARLTFRCDFSSNPGTDIFRNILMSHSLVDLSIDDCEFCGFPSYEQGMCRNLQKLELSYSKNSGKDVMGILGKFPVLRHLSFSEGTIVPTNLICVANSFPELKSLYLRELNDLRKWEVEERAMPKLTRLKIDECRELEGLPLISTLRELSISQMPKEFNDKLRVVNGQPGEDYHKVSHIPSLELFDENV